MHHRSRHRDAVASAAGDMSPGAHAEMLAIIAELEKLVATRGRSTSPRHSGRLLGNLLVTRGLIAGRDLERALARQSDEGGRLGDIVVELGYITEQALLELLAEQLRMDVLDVNRMQLDPEIAVRLHEEDARRLAAVPLRRVDASIEVAVAEPTRPDLVRQLTHLLQAPVCLYLTTQAVIDELIDNVLG
jgi:MSHA biogenesis protein MshE